MGPDRYKLAFKSFIVSTLSKKESPAIISSRSPASSFIWLEETALVIILPVGAEGGVVSEIEAGATQDSFVAVHVSVKPLVPSGSDMVPEPVPLADVALGNDGFSVPVYVPHMLPDPYDALT